MSKYPRVEINLDGCRVPVVAVKACIWGIQSYISAPNYKHGAFLKKHTMECVRSVIAGFEDFMQQEDFNPWNRICSDGHVVFMERLCELFKSHLSRRKEGGYQRL